ncbi:MAG: hypothetical protein ACPKQO_06865 [Nitrososphaeraceae archaeon]
MNKTNHHAFQNDEVIYTYKRKKKYKCSKCGKISFRKTLRPSSEAVY